MKATVIGGGGWETNRGADASQGGIGAPIAGAARPRAGSHAGRTQLVQVHAGRRGQVLRPLFAFRGQRVLLALLHDGKACHDGRQGNQTDTQGANKRLP